MVACFLCRKPVETLLFWGNPAGSSARLVTGSSPQWLFIFHYSLVLVVLLGHFLSKRIVVHFFLCDKFQIGTN